jgi:hypothetical protein
VLRKDAKRIKTDQVLQKHSKKQTAAKAGKWGWFEQKEKL